jgi:hypothetical protein
VELHTKRYSVIVRRSRILRDGAGGAEAMGRRSILNDMSIERKTRLSEDSTAAKGIAERTGLGRGKARRGKPMVDIGESYKRRY